MNRDDPAQLRAQRRAVARAHHPDLGGNSADFAAAMSELERSGADRAPQHPSVEVHASVRAPWLRRTVRHTRRAVRELRSRIPPSVPGSRRYFHLDQEKP